MKFSKLSLKLNKVNILLLATATIFLFAICFFFCGCSVFKGSKNPVINEIIKDAGKVYDPNGVIEKAATETIAKDTGLDVDLSPREAK